MTLTPTRPTPGAWPGLDAVPGGPRTAISAAVARRLFFSAIRRLPVTVHLDGETLGLGGPEMTVRRPDEFFERLGRDGLIGFGEGYLTGAWDAEDLTPFLTVLAADVADLVPRPLQRLRALVQHRMPRAHRTTKDQTRELIAHHYDLSNDLFRTFLDESLSYSSAWFDGAPDGDLREAQLRKIDRLLDVARVGEGTRVLEIGTGWGELAIRAAARGASVRSVTLSSEQQSLARERIEAAGLTERVQVDLCDYRDVDGEYDAVLSVEMIEAVGAEYWPTYFATIDSLLAPGGRAAIQAILMPHDRMLATRGSFTWINKYIFPGGFLPSAQAIDEVTREHTSLRVSDRMAFGQDYAETLRRWDDTFLEHADAVRRLGFDETFLRMWHFYLCYSRAGFASGYLDVEQVLLERARA
ncbi:cyclopropane-fatty-acyl-phospholipid synthase [Nocardioides sp. Root1257]|uniref:class I SAM-dependent methyltransferase n=1 Tax=unclassified Nocardioides TaxID=2615069 RepID=UPI0006F85A7D|nr:MULTISPECIES: class I SAM-dependent methyltransferase [unclassified Nocardioides]KQW47777.1 cyclopropane-fatty-acyl-phospholipid synthase [Nocardioides sp. Root1257]KRC45029.1 cyclopropane-fatty-acyl-phospholipid synthase [Nocardioides sp. Root224]